MSSLLPATAHLHPHNINNPVNSLLSPSSLHSRSRSRNGVVICSGSSRREREREGEGEAGRGRGRVSSGIRKRLRKLCREGRLESARLLLESLPRPVPTLLYNTLLISYVSHSLPNHALRLYALLNHRRPHPLRSDPYTYSSALTACARARLLLLGTSIHAHILRRSLPASTVLHNSLLNFYSSCSRARLGPDLVRHLFDTMRERNVVSWNTVFAWYVKTGRPREALALLNLMLQAGVPPTPVTFVHIFPAAAGLSSTDDDPHCSLMLYGLLVKHGTEYVDDPFVVSSAIGMFSELGDVQSARQVFDCAAKKNTEVWNTMMTGYLQNGQSAEAIDLFIHILVGGREAAAFDDVTFLQALMAASQSQDGRLGQQMHGYLIKRGRGRGRGRARARALAGLPLILSNALIVMYSRCGHVHTAFELFQQLPEKDIVSWNTMITALVQNDFNSEGLLLVFEMQKCGFAADSVTLTALLSAASNMGDLQIGKQAHGYLLRHGICGDGMESYLIDMYSKSGHVEMARRVFDGCSSDDTDEVTWNAIIAGYVQSGQAEQAVSVFRSMLEAGLEPTPVTLASLLPACEPTEGGVSAGRQIHGFAVRRCMDTNVFVGSALVDMYSKCGDISTAERIFGEMREKSTVTYTTMISGLAQRGFGARAVSLFSGMQEVGIKPDAVTFLAVISACSVSGLIEEGLALYKSMGTLGVVATPQHHCCVVELLAGAGRLEEAYEFAQGLGEDGSLIAIWGSLLASCEAHRKLDLAKLVSERLHDIEKEYGIAGCNGLHPYLFAAEGNWTSVDRVKKEMRIRGMIKGLGSSWIEVDNTTHGFTARDQTNDKKIQYPMLQQLATRMKSQAPKSLHC